jgi:hypothetical protein
MGDLNRSILNRANVPVLVARAGPPKAGRTLWNAIKGVFGKRYKATRGRVRTPKLARIKTGASLLHEVLGMRCVRIAFAFEPPP